MVFYRNLKPSFSPSAKYLSEKERSCLHTSLLLKCLRFIPAITSRFLNVTKHVLVFEHAQQKFQAFSARHPFFLAQPNCLAVGEAQLCSREGTCGDLILAALFRRIRLLLHADNLNRLTSKTSSETDCATQTSISFTYHGGTGNTGQRTGMTDGSGSTSWSYDLRGRMLQEVKTITGAPASFTTAWTYNSADMPVTISKFMVDGSGQGVYNAPSLIPPYGVFACCIPGFPAARRQHEGYAATVVKRRPGERIK